MLKEIVAAKALGDYRLHLRFEDGVEGAVDLAPHLSQPAPRNSQHVGSSSSSLIS
jgi:hypothetical protein